MSGNATAETGAVQTDPAPVTVSNTPDGFIVGIDPARSPDQIRQGQQAAQPPAPAQQSNGERMFTATEVEGFRQQEKDKLYTEVGSMRSELEAMRAEREAERAAQEAAQADAEAAARAAAEEEMSVRDLLYQTKETLEAEIRQAREDAERANALLEQERRLQGLNEYRSQAIQANSDRIHPEFIDFIGGDSPEQIDASIQDALVRSERVVQGALAAQQQQLQGMRGARITAPSGNGPLEEQQETRQMTPEQIRALSPSEFQAMRGTLHAAGRAQFYGQNR